MKRLLSFVVAVILALSVLPFGAVSLAEKAETASPAPAPKAADESTAHDRPEPALSVGSVQPAVYSDVVFDFEDTPDSDGFYFFDRDHDGNNWFHDNDMGSWYGCHDGDGAISSISWDESDGAYDPDNWMMTPPLHITGSSMLTFWIRSGDEQHTGDYVEVLASLDGGESWDDVMAVYADEDWEEVGTDISDWSGASVILAFRHYNSPYASGVNLDDITITDAELASAAIGHVNGLDFRVPEFNGYGSSLPHASFTVPYEITYARWIAHYDGADHVMNGSDRFVRTDAQYRLHVEYEPISWYYTFTSNCALFFNGSDQYLGQVTRTSRKITVETVPFTVSMGTAIDEVSISGFTVPQLGATAESYLDRSVPDGAHYHIVNIAAVDDTTGDEVTVSTVFESGHNYSINVYIEADHGYYFSDNCIYSFNYVLTDVDMAVSGRDSYTTALVASKSTMAMYGLNYINAKIPSFPPKAGETAPSGAENCISDSSYYDVIDFRWFDADTGAYFTGVFETGHEYYCYYQVIVSDDYFFFTEDSTAAIFDHEDLIDNYSPHIESDYRSAQIYSACVAAVDEDHVIHSANVLRFVPPMIGRTAGEFYDTYYVPEDMPYYVGAVAAADVTSGQSEYLEYEDVYESGRLYDYAFVLQPKEGYCFAPDCVLLLHGRTLYVDETSSNADDPYAAYICTPELSPLIPITYVDIEGYTIPPMIGDDPADCLDLNIANNAHCFIGHKTWISDMPNGGFEYAEGAFQAGTEYYCACKLLAESGYGFDPDCTFMINGGTYYFGSSDFMGVYDFSDIQVNTIYMEAADESAFIHSIDLQNLTYPVLGASVLGFMTTICAPEGAPYSVVNIDSGEHGVGLFTGSEVFEAGHSYSLAAAVQPERGWYIADDCEFYIDGSSLLVDPEYSYVASRSTAWVSTKELQPKIAISEVHINGFAPAVAGDAASAHMNVTLPGGAVYELLDVAWIETDPETWEWERFNGTFGSDHYYHMGFVLGCDDDYIFTNDTVVYINNEEADFTLQGSGTTLHTSTEPVYAIEPLTEINVLVPRAPIAGEGVLTYLNTLNLPEGVGYDFLGCSILDLSADRFMSSVDVFEEGVEYKLYVYLAPTDGNAFSMHADLLINGGSGLVDSSLSYVYVGNQKALIVTNEMLCEAAAGLPGDVNCDGEITAIDALMALRLALGSNQVNVSPQGLINADTDGNGEISAVDALKILRWALAQ